MSDTSETVQKLLYTLPSEGECSLLESDGWDKEDTTFYLNYSESDETGWSTSDSETESETFTEVSCLGESDSSYEETLYKIGPMYCDGSERESRVKAIEKIRVLFESGLV